MFKNVKLSGKLWGLTLVLLFAVLMVAGNSIWSINGILSANRDFSSAAGTNTFMVAKEVDHLAWIKQVQDLFVANRKTLDVQLDHTQCGLGKFLHGDEGRALAESDPKMASLLDAIKAPHQHLHESARGIKEVWRQAHPGLSLTLAERLDDHRRWAASISKALLEKTDLNVEVNPEQCAFGQWLNGPECRRLVDAWPAFGTIMQKVIGQHAALHKSAAAIKAAGSEQEMTEIYTRETLPRLNAVAGLFEKAQRLEAERNTAQEKARQILNSVTFPAINATQSKMKALADQLDLVKAAADNEMVSTGNIARWSAVAVTVATFIIGSLLSFFIIRSITKPIARIIAGLNEGAEQVASASGQVSSASQQLAEGASEQAASIEETSSSLEEMSSMTNQNADNAGQADNLMKDANQVITRADAAMTDLTASMEDISNASEETSKIIKTIDEIAFQTNLLALNAAVEAARAGEAGAGFAVVADEVRNLAMRAAEAAKDTAVMIEGTVKKIGDGSQLVNNTNDAFGQVAESAAKVGELVAEIAAASNEQAQGIGQVNTAVAEMDKVTQQNAANAEESASASEEMNAQAEQMKGMVMDLVNLVGGKTAASRHHEPSGPKPSAADAPHHHLGKTAVKRPRPAGNGAVSGISPEAEKLIPFEDDDFSDF